MVSRNGTLKEVLRTPFKHHVCYKKFSEIVIYHHLEFCGRDGHLYTLNGFLCLGVFKLKRHLSNPLSAYDMKNNIESEIVRYFQTMGYCCLQSPTYGVPSSVKTNT